MHGIYLNESEYFFTEEEIEDIVFDKEKSKKIKLAIDKLPAPQNRIIYLADIEEMSYKEISKVLDLSMSQVKTLIHRGRKKLKKILEKEIESYNG